MIRVQSAALVGTSSLPVEISAVKCGSGESAPRLSILGLPKQADTNVRVRAALVAEVCRDPAYTNGTTIDVSPAQKSSQAFDLPIALAALAAPGYDEGNPGAEAAFIRPRETWPGAPLSGSLESTLVLGELSLSGEVRPVRGVLAHLLAARERGLRAAIVPQGNAAEASRAVREGFTVHLADTLAAVVAHLAGGVELPACAPWSPPAPYTHDLPDFADVRGNPAAVRALEIAAAGGHSVLLVGAPGSGKTMLARRLVGILPAPSAEESTELASIAGVAGLGPVHPGRRPFRAPHHTASEVACVGGGDPVRPGEVTLAHGGVLFLDELPEFRRPALAGIINAVGQGASRVSRGGTSCSMPAKPLVVAAMNPCPCGLSGPGRACTCSKELIKRWVARVGTPCELTVRVHSVRSIEIKGAPPGESSATIRARVEAARAFNAARPTPGIRPWRDGALALVQSALTHERIGRIASDLVARVAGTIADLDGAERVSEAHVAEALCLVSGAP